MTKPCPAIVTRRVSIDFSTAQVGDWMRDDRDYENVLNAISFLFPAGETYFIQSVNYYMDRIRDPDLKERARRFIYQEAMHTREHARANKLLVDVYPQGKVMERMAKTLLAISRRCNPRSAQLATTCALEHFTAMFAHVLLRRQDEFIAQSDKAFANLWLWHAVEETEHKAVCFDVYEYVCGKGLVSYLQRIGVMFAISIIFVMGLAIGFTIIQFQQKMQRFKHWCAGTLVKTPKSAGSAKVSKLFKGIAPSLYFDYYRRSFHPWDHDNSDLIDKWKKHHADFGGTPNTESAN